jgi:D-tyrosyl-tRNA(Tyr) deacylase
MRPGFSDAAPPQQADQGIRAFVDRLQDEGLRVETGRFQADMQVYLINDGPVTFWLEKGGESP